MRVLARKILLIVFFCIVSICVLWSMNFIIQYREDAVIDKKIILMSLDEKIGQLIMMGINTSRLSPSVEQYLKEIKPGGVILFRKALRTQEQTRELIGQIQEVSSGARGGIPLFVAVDQEGGKVNRVDLGLTHIPGNMAISVTGREKYARIAGEINGMELHSMGINVNLAPCVDVLHVATNEVIGTRSFGSEILPVGQFANAYFNGLKKYQVLGCAKHFPNHGVVEEDSHHVLPQSDLKQEQIFKDLLPYRMLINNNIDMIMPAHISWTGMDEPNLPGTFSKKMIVGLLRNKLEYSGVVISDAIEMQAISSMSSYADAAVNFIKAGGDIILIGKRDLRIKEIVQGMHAAVQKGEISETRINESVKRVLKLKMKIYPDLAYEKKPYVLVAGAISQNKRMAYTIAQKSIRQYGDWGHMPVVTEETNMLILSSSHEWKNIMSKTFEKYSFIKIPPVSAEC